jgi:hypothetical protein
MPGRKEMILELKSKVIPVLKEFGFNGTFPHFRRINGDKINLLTFQFDKWGGGFCIEITNGNPKGFNLNDKFIEPNKMRAWDINNRLRLGAKDINSDYWFRFDNNAYSTAANEVLEKLPIAEDWYKNSPVTT